MQEADALRITAYLNAAYPNMALDEASVAVFSKELALLVDPRIAMEAAQKIVRTMTRFPTIADFRGVYRSVNEGRRRGEEKKELASPPEDRAPIPEWVSIWWWSTHMRDPIVKKVPKQVAGDGYPALSKEEYEQLKTEWIELGRPTASSVTPRMKEV